VGLLDNAWRYSPAGFEEITDPLAAQADRRLGSHLLEQAGYREQTWFGADAGAAFRLELWTGETTAYPFLVRVLLRDQWWPIDTHALPDALHLLERWVPLVQAAMTDALYNDEHPDTEA
jgi:hypothetical protein